MRFRRDGRPKAPTLWVMGCVELLTLTSDESFALWRGVAQSRWSVVIDFRQRCLFEPLASVEIFQRLVTPAALCRVLDGLVGEGLFRRTEMNSYTEKILQRVDKQGQWKQPVYEHTTTEGA